MDSATVSENRVLERHTFRRQITAEERALIGAIVEEERARKQDPLRYIQKAFEEAAKETERRLLEGVKDYKETPDLAAANAERHRALASRQLSANLGARYTAERLDLGRFEIYHADQRAVVERVRALAERLPELVKQGVGLIWYGGVGSGKDHLMGWLLHQAAGRYGISCRWEFGLDLFGVVRDRMDSGHKEEDLLRELARPDVLAISDPLPAAGGLSPFRLEFLHRLAERRYRQLKPTWVTMNALSPEDADEQLSAQVFDRLRESAEMFPCFWPSFRERKGRLVG